ncbi:MAG: cytidylate kinase-like family protein [Clostridia bacterium]|nr:cytidylate kinase-like family protein [Clostridia bacterium]
MRIITVSRQFSSGGRELAKRMADVLGFDYYDKEIITEIAKSNSLDEGYVESSLSKGYKAVPLHFARSFSFAFTSTAKSELLVEEKRVIDEIAKKGRDFIIVGRNADILLKEYKPLNIFVCADHESKVQRCIDKALIGENPSRKEIERHLKQIDKNRASTRAILSETKWGECVNYHMVINTTGWQIKELTPIISRLAELYFGDMQ